MRHSKPNRGYRGKTHKRRCRVCGVVVGYERRVMIKYQDEREFNPSGGWVILYLCPLHYKPIHQAIRKAAKALSAR